MKTQTDKELEDEISNLDEDIRNNHVGFTYEERQDFIDKRELLKAQLQGRKDKAKEIKQFIESERDNGNCEPQFKGIKKDFSAGLCLNKLLKELGEKK